MSEGFNPVFAYYEDLAIDINASSNSESFNVAGFSNITYQAVLASGTFSSAIFTGQCSVDGTNWVDIATSTVGAGPGIRGELTVGSEYFRVRVSTTEGGAGTANIFVNAKR